MLVHEAEKTAYPGLSKLREARIWIRKPNFRKPIILWLISFWAEKLFVLSLGNRCPAFQITFEQITSICLNTSIQGLNSGLDLIASSWDERLCGAFAGPASLLVSLSGGWKMGGMDLRKNQFFLTEFRRFFRCLIHQIDSTCNVQLLMRSEFKR